MRVALLFAALSQFADSRDKRVVKVYNDSVSYRVMSYSEDLTHWTCYRQRDARWIEINCASGDMQFERSDAGVRVRCP